MKIKSVSGITCYVNNLNETVAFYEALGFEARKRETDHVTVYSNWFWINFIPDKGEGPEFSKDVKLNNKGAGLFLYLNVENVDEFYKELLSKGLKPLSEPRNFAGGNREFTLRDPDGYHLVIFRRK